MTLQRRVLVVGIGVILGVWWSTCREPGVSPAASTTSPPAGSPPGSSGPSAAPSSAPSSAASPGTSPARAHIPRVTRSGGAVAPSDGGAAPTTPGPVDRRENPPADAEQVRAAILSRMDAVRDDLSDCVGSWMALDPTLSGQVNVGFQIDATGLTDAWVADHTDVPMGPLSCFSSAVYGVDWTGVTLQPLEVTFPFVFSPDDPEADLGPAGGN